MKDAEQKNLVFKHFSSQGWFALPEIPVYFSGGQHDTKKLITDIDVLGLRPGNSLNWEIVLADCKTLKGVVKRNQLLEMTTTRTKCAFLIKGMERVNSRRDQRTLSIARP